MAKLKYRPKNSAASVDTSKANTPVNKSVNGDAKNRGKIQTRRISADRQIRKDPSSLENENDRLRGENKSLRSRLLQSVANSDINSVVSQQTYDKDDDDETFMMLQEYMVENENLRTRNSELVILQEQVEKNYQHLQMENDDLKTRITHLERSIQSSRNNSPAAGDVQRSRQSNKVPGAQGASSTRGANLLMSHEKFLMKMNNDRGEAGQRHNAFLRGSPRLSQNYPSELSSVLSKPLPGPHSQSKPTSAGWDSENEGGRRSASDTQKKAALKSTNRILPSKVQKKAVVSGGGYVDSQAGQSQSGYLRKYRSKSPGLDHPTASSKTPINSTQGATKSPRQVAIIKPKQKTTQSEYHSYLTMQQKKSSPVAPVAQKQSHQPPQKAIPEPVPNTYSSNYKSSVEGPISVIKSRPVPPHKRTPVGPIGSTSFKLSQSSNVGGESSSRPRNSQTKSAAWNVQLQSLSDMNSKMRSEIRNLEYQINNLK